MCLIWSRVEKERFEQDSSFAMEVTTLVPSGLKRSYSEALNTHFSIDEPLEEQSSQDGEVKKSWLNTKPKI